MKLTSPHWLPLLTLAGGAALLAAAAACGGNSKDEQTAANATDESTSTATSTATATATATASPTATATATPTPFAGNVARMVIPRFKVDAPIEDLGLVNPKDPGSNLDTPKDENRSVGWYYIYDRPGWSGNAVFSAHVYYHNIPAPFQNLSKAAVGDDIKIVMENGTEYAYKVVSNKRYNRDTIPMGDIIWPKDRTKEWITLITCGGELDSTGWEYVSRDVIVAERVQ